MNDTTMTMVGNLVDEPAVTTTHNGSRRATFRVASTSRRYDRGREGFVDRSTVYLTVVVWGNLAENVAQSLHKGMSVLVTGRLDQYDYRVDEQSRTRYEIHADAVGVSLSFGVASFQRVSRVRPPAATSERDATAPVPADLVPAGVDQQTGEIAEPAELPDPVEVHEVVDEREFEPAL